MIGFNESRPLKINIWQSDLTWLMAAPNGTVIQITELPAQGGNTAWASLSKTFAALSPGFQHYFEA